MTTLRQDYDALLSSASDARKARVAFILRAVVFISTQGKPAMARLAKDFTQRELAHITGLIAPYFLGTSGLDDKGRFCVTLSREAQEACKKASCLEDLPLSGPCVKGVCDFIRLMAKLPAIRRESVRLSEREALEKAASVLAGAGYAALAEKVKALRLEKV